jgi:hypothetical protein
LLANPKCFAKPVTGAAATPFARPVDDAAGAVAGRGIAPRGRGANGTRCFAAGGAPGFVVLLVDAAGCGAGFVTAAASAAAAAGSGAENGTLDVIAKNTFSSIPASFLFPPKVRSRASSRRRRLLSNES